MTRTTTSVAPRSVTVASDGQVWFTQEAKGNAARITNDGVITEGEAVKSSTPFGITVAPDGSPWYTLMGANRIATLQLR